MQCRAVEKALVAGHTKLVMLESPTNPRMQICDIATLTQMAHQVCCTALYACCVLLVLYSLHFHLCLLCLACVLFILPSALHVTAACFVLSWQGLWLPCEVMNAVKLCSWAAFKSDSRQLYCVLCYAFAYTEHALMAW